MSGANEILVEQLLCVNQRVCSHTCTKCQAVCPQNAVEINPITGNVTLSSACTHCGLCIIECPAQAIYWHNLMRYPLKINERKIKIFCTEIKCDGYASCLANLNEYELAYLALKAEVILCLDQAVCMQCNPMITSYIHKIVERVNQFLSNLDVRPITFSVQQKKIAEQINRRELFSFVFTKLKQSISEVLPTVEKTSEYRSLLITELQQRFTEAKGTAAPLFRGAKGLVNCTLCGICVRACRNKALHIVIDQDKNRGELQHDQTVCTGCGICSILCPEKAIEISTESSSLESIGKNKPALVRERSLSNCKMCGTAIVEGTQMVCQDCRRKQNKKMQDIY